MSVSAIFGTRIAVVPQPPSLPPSRTGGGATKAAPPRVDSGSGGFGLVIESSSRPQKKATAHHRKTRPRKTQPWDVRRGPAVYPPLPQLPPEWTLVTDETVVEASSPPVPLTAE
ncbi:hypothetical protein RJ640_005994 [Escallonia rubra]|uniref:50S ribosomal protein 6, chloroplastic n=1 Tax=Escallonia rubra TaxID=112253 RepID=A0AA88R414_9ASTE|nr:hypothetical protein RJ640_005994 [Escallonia rubra]